MSEAGIPLSQRIEIEHLCTRLSIDYSFYADAGRMDEWAELFTEDAEMVVMGRASSGRAAIRASVGSGNAAAMITFHSVSNIRIDVLSPTEATGTVPVTVYMAARDGETAKVESIAPSIIGTYFDSYRKTAEGWRFVRREFKPSIMKAA